MRVDKTLVGEVRALRDRQLRFVLSDGTVDRDNDTIAPDGWDLEAYRRCPVVLWAHSTRDLPVAKAVDVGVKGDALVAVAEFAEHDFARTVHDLYVGGYLRAVSVGFRAKRYERNAQRGGTDFLEQELLEFSCVPVPANSNALLAAAAAGIDTKVLRDWASRALRETDDDEPVLEVDEALAAAGRAAEARAAAQQTFDADPHVLAQLVAEAVRDGLRDMVAAAVRLELRRRRGLLD